MKTKHILSIINAAVQDGFEFDPSDSMEDVSIQAEDYLLENEPYGHLFVQCDLSGHGMSQGYTCVDEDGYDITSSGEIFDFRHAKKDDEVYFQMKGNDFEPVDWFEIPDDESRRDFVFVYDKVVCADGKIAYLYDNFA